MAEAAVERRAVGAAACWFALALMGQAASLRLVEAGPRLHYQHYPPLDVLAARHPLLLGVIAVQTVAAGLGWLRVQRSSRRITLPRGRLFLAVVLSASTAATVSPRWMLFVVELLFAAFLQFLALATVALAALAVPDVVLRRLHGVATTALGDDGAPSSAHRLDRLAWSAAAVTTVLAAALSVWSYERHPHVPDEVVYLQHARYFAAGLTSLPVPPVPEAFDVDLMHTSSGRWFSPVSPGWPAVLSVGVLVRAPWLVNPVLAGLNVLLAYLLLGHLYSRRVARAAAGLLALSPWFLFLGMSFMTHMLTLTCALLAALGLARSRRSGSASMALVAGAAVGATSLIRPLDGLIIGGLVALWAIGVGGTRLRPRALLAVAVGAMAIGGLTFPYNKALTGHALTFPINAYVDAHYAPNANAYGFGPDRGMGWPLDPNPGHGPVDAVINLDLNAFGLTTDLFGWSVGSLACVAWLLAGGHLSRADRVMLSVVGAVVTAYFFYYYSGGPDFGARYWFPVVVPLVALTARGAADLTSRAGPRVPVALAALVAMSLVTFVPWRAVDKYRGFRGMRPDVRRLAADRGFGRDLVLVRGERFPDYASAFVENPLDLHAAATVYAWDRSPAVRAAVARSYPDRRFWLVDGPSITGAGYRVSAGPLTVASLLGDEPAR